MELAALTIDVINQSGFAWLIFPLSLFILTTFLLSFFGLRPQKYKKQHNIKKSFKALEKLKSIEDPRQQFGYLRKIDPFIFEEMILSALGNHGHKIIRNKRYTGDGGIDGKAILNGERYFIQAKRYKRYINAQHVRNFDALCKQYGVKGLFIHTGKTGGMSSQLVRSSDSIEIVSGERLLKLLGANIPGSRNRTRIGRQAVA